MILFYFFILFVMIQRLIELNIANRNEKWMKDRGGIEVGKEHYKFFILLHIMFFIFLIMEVHFISFERDLPFHIILFIIFIFAQIGRVWCITSLGKFWNTKIIVLPKITIIKKGPYKYVKHPNYIIVFIELVTIPLMFNAFLTAIIFPMLHLLLLTVRVPSEDSALGRRV